MNRNDAHWINKNQYYYQKVAQFHKFVIPTGSRVLQVECRSGFFLNNVNPSYGLGIDTDDACIKDAQSNYSACQNLEFKTITLKQLAQEQKDLTFDYIILAHTLMHEHDIQDFLETLQQFCTSKTRLVITICSWVWEPIISLGQRIGLNRNAPFKNWIALADLENFLRLADFEPVSMSRRTLIPKNIPLLAPFFNKCIANLPLIEKLCLDQCVVARSILPSKFTPPQSSSIIVPCRNEKGTIASIINKLPALGASTEVIFIEGHSHDGTLEEIKKLCAQTQRNGFSYRYAVQPGKGKWDAVKTGYAMATGEVLIIFDADMTVPPEELPKFWNALASNKGEFVNGVRLVYAMENNAMRHLNLIANKIFGLGFSWLLQQRIKDTLCGTKVLRRSDWEKINTENFLKNHDPFGDFELIFGAVKQNLKLIDLPIHYKDRTYGSTQISRFKHGLMLLKMCIIGTYKFKIQNR